MGYTLHTAQDDFSLHANADTERGAGVIQSFTANLTDASGNKLTDASGNYLTAVYAETIYPQILHALPDDFALNSE
jgi:hypothetical protein